MPESVFIAGVIGESALLVRGGAAALDHSGTLMAVEITQGIMVADVPGSPRIQIATELTPLRALAVHAGAGLVAAGTADDHITLFRLENGYVSRQLSMRTGLPTALAFNTNGKLLAAGGDDGLVILFRTDTGDEVCRFRSEVKIRALALSGSGYPVLIGDTSGRVVVWRRVRPPLEVAGRDSAVTALLAIPHTRKALVGRTDNVIDKIHVTDLLITPQLLAGARRIRGLTRNPRGPVMPLGAFKVRTSDRGVTPPLEAGTGPVFALAHRSRNQVTALHGDAQLSSLTLARKAPVTARNLVLLPGRGVRRLREWWLELRPLVTHFAAQREDMRRQIQAGRGEMLDQLDSLGKATRSEIRQTVVDSAVLVYDASAFDLAVRKVVTVNPLPRLAGGFVAALLSLVLLLTLPVQAVWHRHGSDAPFIVLGIFAAGVVIMHELRRFGAVGRAAQAMITAVGVTVAVAGPRISVYSQPSGAGRWIARWLPAADDLQVRLSIPDPVRLGVACLVLFLLTAGAARCLLRFVRTPKKLPERYKVRGAALLHGLLDVAYQAQRMAGDQELAVAPQEIRRLFRGVQRAASIASRQWAPTLRIGHRQADRMLRDRGWLIAGEIRRHETRVAAAGAELPSLSWEFATMVAKAARKEWLSLSGDQAASTGRRRSRGLALVRQVLALAVPLGAAAAILFDIRPLPTALFTFLVGISIARVLRWLDSSSDIEAALKIAEDLRKP